MCYIFTVMRTTQFKLEESQPTRVNKKLYLKIIELSKREGKLIRFLIDAALLNYLKSKKIKL